jgi:hypothetical protein
VTAIYSNFPAPVFGSFQLGVATNLTLSAQAFASQSWILQSSTDLMTWVNAMTNTSDGAGSLQFTTPPITNGPWRFYRIRSP